MIFPKRVPNYIAGGWLASDADHQLPVHNPATGETLSHTPLSSSVELDRACTAAFEALSGWRRTPVGQRVQFLFELKNQLERHFEDLARTITQECGKTLGESRGELRRAIDNVECACGIVALMSGDVVEDIAAGIDETMIRQPVGVCGIIAPFNFPAMIPFWFLPYAMACGNTVVLKPSERVPLTMNQIFGLLDEIDLPAGVVNLIHGDAGLANDMLEHPLIKAISFVGSSRAARNVYARAAANGKRVQAQGGAKNPIVVLPDADLDAAVSITADSAFGCAGQRCLAASIAVTVGEGRECFLDAISEVADSRIVGSGLDPQVQMGPVISPQSRDRIGGFLDRAQTEGATFRVDGRRLPVKGFESGNFLRPTVLDNVAVDSEVACNEVFGPVLGVTHVDSVEDAIALVNNGRYGNMACVFTRDGAAARAFRYETDVGNVGINIGVAAPTAPFPFSGWKDSFFGTLHGQGKHAVEFFTQTKVVVERWTGRAHSVFESGKAR